MAKTKENPKKSNLGSVHRTTAGLPHAGVSDAATLRDFDALCLTPLAPMDSVMSRGLFPATARQAPVSDGTPFRD